MARGALPDQAIDKKSLFRVGAQESLDLCVKQHFFL
jgi:hypothetical protein